MAAVTPRVPELEDGVPLLPFLAVGWDVAAVLMLVRALGLVEYSLGVPYLVFAAAACVACLLEWRYWQRTGSHFYRTA
jgi:hypothetical protein